MNKIQSSTETESLSLDLRKSKVTGKWGTTTTDAKYDNARLSWKRQRSRCAERGFKDGQPSKRMRLSGRFADYLYGLLRSVHSKGSTSWVYLIVGSKREMHITTSFMWGSERYALRNAVLDEDIDFDEEGFVEEVE